MPSSASLKNVKNKCVCTYNRRSWSWDLFEWVSRSKYVWWLLKCVFCKSLQLYTCYTLHVQRMCVLPVNAIFKHAFVCKFKACTCRNEHSSVCFACVCTCRSWSWDPCEWIQCTDGQSSRHEQPRGARCNSVLWCELCSSADATLGMEDVLRGACHALG